MPGAHKEMIEHFRARQAADDAAKAVTPAVSPITALEVETTDGKKSRVFVAVVDVMGHQIPIALGIDAMLRAVRTGRYCDAAKKKGRARPVRVEAIFGGKLRSAV